MAVTTSEPRALPWENIQTSFPEGTKFRDAIEQMNLNYEVEFRPIVVEGVGPIERHRATVRTDTNGFLGIVGGRYNIVQNRDAFSFMEAIVDSGDMVPLGGGHWKGGARPWIQARLPEDIIVAGDTVNERIVPFIFAGTSHDGSIPVTISLTGIRVICKNTYAANVGAPRRFQVRHTASYDAKVNEARRVLGISFSYFAEYGEFLNGLAQETFVDDDFRALVNALFPLAAKGSTDLQKENIAKKRAALLGVYLNSPTVPRGTKYGALQAVTEWYDHVKNGQRKRGTREAAELKSTDILLGEGVDFKDRAVALLVRG